MGMGGGGVISNAWVGCGLGMGTFWLGFGYDVTEVWVHVNLGVGTCWLGIGTTWLGTFGSGYVLNWDGYDLAWVRVGVGTFWPALVSLFGASRQYYAFTKCWAFSATYLCKYLDIQMHLRKLSVWEKWGHRISRTLVIIVYAQSDCNVFMCGLLLVDMIRVYVWPTTGGHDPCLCVAYYWWTWLSLF